MTDAEPERCCFDDWVDRWSEQAAKHETVAGVTAPLLEALGEAGLRGRTVLDIGCGIGDLALATLGHGATRATGFDLSPKAIEGARRLAEERGVADRATFDVGDGSKVDLPRTDVVVLNRVICCYPNAGALLERSLAAAGVVYAFTAPVSKGVVGLGNKVWSRIGNVWLRLRPKHYGGFQTFIHDLELVDERVRAAGFRLLRRERRRFVWHLAVYER
jgi:magnesium-protoporphyrin O-methyltransferase